MRSVEIWEMVDQAVNARDDLSEGAESGHRNNLSGDNVADLVISLEHFPRVVLGLLVAQGDLSCSRCRCP